MSHTRRVASGTASNVFPLIPRVGPRRVPARGPAKIIALHPAEGLDEEDSGSSWASTFIVLLLYVGLLLFCSWPLLGQVGGLEEIRGLAPKWLRP